MRILLCIALALAGCIERRSDADDPEGADASPPDQGVADARLSRPDGAPLPDMAPPPDMAPRPDSGSPLVAPIPGPDPSEGPPFARLISCELDRTEALTAIVRLVACLPELRGDDQTTVHGLFEAWEAGLFAGVGDNAQSTSPVPIQFGCGAIQCLVDAADCEAAALCLDGRTDPDPVPDEECEPGSEWCDGDQLVRCGYRGSTYVAMDCALLGMTCGRDLASRRALCASDTCRLRAEIIARSCEGDALVMCDGAIRLDCDAWRDGGQCQSFAIGGEFPTAFCGPPGFGGAGAYNQPVECGADGAFEFTPLQADTYRVDCRAAGYSGCDARGCVP